ncbi:MAG: hypothetical protein NWF00_08635 [Candidatus Bathyarchaeota archaeon]|nr:hypothetical protein [Candidatus Bathyarchaeota archaeon]
MENVKGLKSLLVITFAVLMMASSFEVIYANAAINKQTSTSEYALPDFLLRLSEYQANGNATELTRIRNQMIEQEKIKQDRIASTKGAVLSLELPDSPLLDWPPVYSWLSTVEFTSPYESYGYIEDADEMIGSSDNSFAHLHTDDWNYDEGDPMGGEAFAGGYTYGGWASGDFYVQGKRGAHWQSGWQNYVMLYTSNNINAPFGQWNYLGYASVDSSSSTEVYIGTSYSTWTCIAIMCWTPPPYPTPYEPLVRNCVLIDNVVAKDIY